MAVTPRGEHSLRQTAGGSGSASPHSDTPLTDSFAGFPPDFRSSGNERSQPPHLGTGVDAELRSILQALPTKADIAALIATVEATHRTEMKAVRAEVSALATRMKSGESSLTALEHRMTLLEDTQDAQTEALQDQWLRLEEMEDRSRRNNLRLRGLPEATGPEDLADTAVAIFRSLPGIDLPEQIELDRIHRALGPKSADPLRPRNVVCRVHHYVHKEQILRKAWESDDPELDGATIKILPDLSRATLQRRAILKPLMDLARRKGATYRWGYPLSVTFRKDQRSFTLRKPDALPALFDFLDTDPIEVPNWLGPLPHTQSRPFISRHNDNLPPRQQRSRRRPRTTSQEDVRES